MALFARTRGKSFLRVADFVVPLVPLGLAAGRIGNFINGELWGRAADASLPWAVVFPQSGDALARHPSQIYQFLLEGVTLFAILWIYSRKPRAPGTVGSLFLIFYGLLRIAGEVFREPEALYGHMPLGLSAGQWLSVPMIVIGVVCFVLLRRNKAAA
jgi:phosphatidylglycerol:prolipoprotein diacylglycerol transferase